LNIEEHDFKDLDSKWESDISENSLCNDDYNFDLFDNKSSDEEESGDSEIYHT